MEGVRSIFMITGSFDPISNCAAQISYGQNYIWHISVGSKQFKDFYFPSIEEALETFEKLSNNHKNDKIQLVLDKYFLDE